MFPFDRKSIFLHYPTIIRKNDLPKHFSVFNYKRIDGAIKTPPKQKTISKINPKHLLSNGNELN
jgi:hypothetical protein